MDNEKLREKKLTEAIATLSELIPSHIIGDNKKRISQYEILNYTIKYIKLLQEKEK